MSSKGKLKYYVVWVGVTPGIYQTWNECKAQISGYPNARYKSYKTLSEAEAAYQGVADIAQTKRTFKVKPNLEDFKDVILDQSISVDAACSGNPGVMEYRGVYTWTGEEIFKMGPFPQGTNNVGEFLALVHGLAWLYNAQDDDTAIYSDSRTAMAWVRNKRMKSTLKRTSTNRQIFALTARAEKWLTSHKFETKIIKWETSKWGEIPADFGRK